MIKKLFENKGGNQFKLNEGLPMGKSPKAQKVANALNSIVASISLPHLSQQARTPAATIINLVDQDEAS